MTIDEIKEKLQEQGLDDTLVFEDPSYADAFIGTSNDNRAVYSYTRMIESLENEGLSYEEAVDHVEFNAIRSLDYHDKAPIVVYDI